MHERTPGIRPLPTLRRQLDVAARRAFPGVTTALLLLLLAAPLGLPGQAELQLALALGCVYFWSLFRPVSLPPPLVFLLGLLADLLGFGPIGVSVLVLLLVHGLAMMWRRDLTRQSFLRVWLAFVAIAAGAAALHWALTSMLTFRLLPAGPALFQATLSAGVYPLLAVALARAHATVAEPARA
jgi:rod shape-determining protein MreD